MSEKIVERNSTEQFREDYKRYGIYITFRRVMPDYRDGLKPVQRRVLWAMYNDSGAVNKTVKSATIIGDVMGKYHAHGDCIHGDTILYSLDGNPVTIGELYSNKINEFHTLGIDVNTGEVIPVVATNFRIGQYTNKEYNIHLSNGAVIKCTGNHPFLNENMEWIKAEDLKPNSRLYSRNIKISSDYSSGPYIGNKSVHAIVHDYYYGTPPAGYERHHKDNNYLNNHPSNLQALGKKDHLDIHNDSRDYLKGLESGRNSMFNDNGKYRNRTKKKNSILASEYNKDLGIRKFQYVIKLMKEQGLDLTEENYESFRGQVYNMPIVSRLLQKHPEYGKSFEDLIKYQLPSLSELYNQRKSEVEEIPVNGDEKSVINPISIPYSGSGAVYRIFNKILDRGLPLTTDNYYNELLYDYKGIDKQKLEVLINLYKIESPYIEKIEIVETENLPMFDFTVDGIENILIPVRTELNDCIDCLTGNSTLPLICIHNSSIYGTMKPMTNWFETYLPTIQGQGSFGNFQGDQASAYRYTEAKVSKFTADCIIDELKSSPKCVDWSPNFDNTLMEPEYLPVKVPLLLINGSFGIGLGKKTEIPTHNTNEVIDATIALMKDPNCDVVLVPDHCMKCEIIDTDFKSISRTGYGYYKVRGVVDIEDYKGNKALVIKGTPNLTFLNDIVEKIDGLIEKKKLVQVSGYYDESSENEMRFVVVLRPGADPNYVRDVLYKETNLEHTERVNFEVLNGLTPVRMSYKSYLLSFIDHRKLTKFRVYSNRLQLVQTRIHEKEIYIKVLESGEVDNIIAFIKKQKTIDDNFLIEYLIKKLKITDLQAKFIINSDLRKLSVGYLNKYKQDIKDLEKEKAQYMAMVMDDSKITEEIIAELEDAKTKYGKRRNCRVIKEKNVNEVPKGAMTIIITEKNMIKKVPKGAPIGSFRGDSIRTIIETDNTDNILIFDNMGKVFRLPIDKIPFVDNKSNGIDIRFIVKGLTADIISCIPEGCVKEAGNKDNIERSYVVCITRNGLIKKMDDSDFINVPPSGIRYVKLDDDDYVVAVRLADDNIGFIAFSDRKAMSVPVNTIALMKRNSKGNKTFKSDKVDGILEFVSNTSNYLLVITQNGKINKLPLSGIPNLFTPRKTFSVIKLTKGDSIQNIIPVNDTDIVRVNLMDGVIDLEVSKYPTGSSISSGEKAIPIRGNKILRSMKLIQ